MSNVSKKKAKLLLLLPEDIQKVITLTNYPQPKKSTSKKTSLEQLSCRLFHGACSFCPHPSRETSKNQLNNSHIIFEGVHSSMGSVCSCIPESEIRSVLRMSRPVNRCAERRVVRVAPFTDLRSQIGSNFSDQFSA